MNGHNTSWQTIAIQEQLDGKTAVKGDIPYPIEVFAHYGGDSEHMPHTGDSILGVL